jgi:hypothetical protein
MQTRDELQPLFAHRKRPLWGLAILAREGDGERLYQFQDGQLRTIKQGYYELLQEVVGHPPERALDIVRDLEAMLRMDRGGRDAQRRSGERGSSFAEQLRVFEDPRWLAEVRGGVEPRSKRHREPAMQQARVSLSADALDALLAEGDAHGVLERARALLVAIDLVGSKDAGPLRRAPEAHEPALARALRELLWGAAPHPERLTAYLAALSAVPKARVSWPLATVFTGLVHPREHLFVKPSVVRQQALWTAPSLPYEATPSAALYERLRAMAEAARGRLVRAGHEPRDLLDVHDFMLETLRQRPRPRSVSVEVAAAAE